MFKVVIVWMSLDDLGKGFDFYEGRYCLISSLVGYNKSKREVNYLILG